MALSFGFLFFVILSGGVKYVLNVYAGRLGEQMLRRLRYTLYFAHPSLPAAAFQESLPGRDHSDDHGRGRAGRRLYRHGNIDAAVFRRTAAGLSGLHLCPGRLSRPGRDGPLSAADLHRPEAAETGHRASARPGCGRCAVLPTTSASRSPALPEIHANDASVYERAGVARRLDRIYTIRYEIFRRKFAIKFLNSFMAATHAVLLLRDRRLSGDRRRHDHRRA